jgi:glycine amidinotransferase
MKDSKYIVNTNNEWDKLEEVIVGRVENSMFPSWDFILKNTIPPEAIKYYQDSFSMRGLPIPPKIIDMANENLEALIEILEKENVKVRRPDLFNFNEKFKTPFWEVETGVSSANPRDVFLVIGDTIIECPMADRGRYFEAFPYRTIMDELSSSGAKWIAAPKPMLKKSFYNNFQKPHNEFSINNTELTFDAADFIRCGKNIIGQLSQVTNKKGVNWLKSILGKDYNIELIKSECKQALHIDTTLTALKEGVLLINPQFIAIEDLPSCFKDWEILIAPKPESFSTQIGNYRVVSDWMSMNMLSIDEEKVIVEEKQTGMIKFLEKHGFTPIPCPFENYYLFGGSFHCATLDLRRKTNK